MAPSNDRVTAGAHDLCAQASDIVELRTLIAALDEAVKRTEAIAVERITVALEGHTRLHDAHAIAHADQHKQSQEALARAEKAALERVDAAMAAHAREHTLIGDALLRADLTMTETARIHAAAHEREHGLAQIALEKSDQTYAAKFEALNNAAARSQEERATFATRDHLTALSDRISAIERTAQGSIDRRALVDTTVARVDTLAQEMVAVRERLAIVAGNTARIDALERTIDTSAGRDKGISLAWTVGIAVVTVLLAIAAWIGSRAL